MGRLKRFRLGLQLATRRHLSKSCRRLMAQTDVAQGVRLSPLMAQSCKKERPPGGGLSGIRPKC
jgi:hypothetical protein